MLKNTHIKTIMTFLIIGITIITTLCIYQMEVLKQLNIECTSEILNQKISDTTKLTVVLDSAYSVMLGVDLEKKEIHVRILNADLANRGDIPLDFQNHVSVGKSYARITNKSFIESLIESGLIDLESVTQRKFVTKFDKNNNTIIIELGRGM